jgi:hypothetical protein
MEVDPKSQLFQENERLINEGHTNNPTLHWVIGSINPTTDDEQASSLQIPIPSELTPHVFTGVVRGSTYSTNQKSSVSSSQLVTKWNIGIKTAQHTIHATT